MQHISPLNIVITQLLLHEDDFTMTNYSINALLNRHIDAQLPEF